jgi:hypothetical protein
MSGVSWLTITGSGLDGWIYYRLLLQSLLSTVNHNCSQSMTAKTPSIPCWTTSVFFLVFLQLASFRFTSHSLLNCECITTDLNDDCFLTDWLGSACYCDWLNDWLRIMSKLCFDRRSVGQPLLVSSTHLGLKTNFFFFWQLRVCWWMWGALSDERTDLSFTMYNIFTFYVLHECIYCTQSGLSVPDHALSWVVSAYEF